VLASEAEGTKLRVAVNGGGCSGFQYVFEMDRSQNEDDIVLSNGAATVLVDEASLGFLAGSTLDFVDDLIGQLENYFEALNQVNGKIGQNLTENDFLMSLRSRVVIPGGTCEFDLPAYHAWQHHSAESRVADLKQWSSAFAPLSQAIHLLLQMLRETGTSQKVMAMGGLFQQNLPQGRTFQLLRLKIDPSLSITPEISCNRLLVVIRMMRQQGDCKLVSIQDDVPFEMAVCA
jgi:cell division protein ZapD